jgi:hypothetical protein
MRTNFLILATLAPLVLTPRSGAQVAIFDNTPTTADSGTSLTSSAVTFGDLVTAGEIERTVTDFSTAFANTGFGSFNGDVSLRFYNRSGNTVGTQIGATVTQTGLTFDLGENQISFSGLNLTVPDTFIWAVTIDNPGTDSINPRIGIDPPSVGSTDLNTCFTATDVPSLAAGQSLETVADGDGNLYASITAVPEPQGTAFAFGFLALLGGFLLRHHRKAKELAA